MRKLIDNVQLFISTNEEYHRVFSAPCLRLTSSIPQSILLSLMSFLTDTRTVRRTCAIPQSVLQPLLSFLTGTRTLHHTIFIPQSILLPLLSFLIG